MSSLTHNIGVRVNETAAEIKMVTARVIANSLKRRPTISPIKSRGIKTAINDMVSEIIVNPI